MTPQEAIAQIRAEIERGGETFRGADFLAAHLLTFLDTLAGEGSSEKPNIHLEKELEAYFHGQWPKTEKGDETLTFTPNAIRRLVRHFYELDKAK